MPPHRITLHCCTTLHATGTPRSKGGEGVQRGGAGREGPGDGSSRDKENPNDDDDHDGDLTRGTNGGGADVGKGGHGHKGAAGSSDGAGAHAVDNGEAMAMEVDAGEGEGDSRERGNPQGFGQENGGQAGAVAANGEGGLSRDGDEGLFKGGMRECGEIPEGDVAVLTNHHSEVSCALAFGPRCLFCFVDSKVSCLCLLL